MDSEQLKVTMAQECNFLIVPNTLKALQKLAEQHRGSFQIPVVGITGSNGKTIVKEWLHQLLSPDRVIVRSPRSYNSQIGVPLSVSSQSMAAGLFPRRRAPIFSTIDSIVYDIILKHWHICTFIEAPIGTCLFLFRNLSTGIFR